MMSCRRCRGWLATAVLAFVTGCGGPAVFDGATCFSDDQCDANAWCHEATQHCVERATAATLGLSVVPPVENNRGYVPFEILFDDQGNALGVERDGLDRVVISAPAAVFLAGRVFQSADQTEGVRSTLVFRRSAMIPGLSSPQAETAAVVSADESIQGDYGLWLTPASEYTVYVKPAYPFMQDFPPLRQRLGPFLSNTGHDLQLDGSDRFVELRGRVLDSEGRALSEPLRVYATDADGRERSTHGITCVDDDPDTCFCDDDTSVSACRGTFRLRLPFGVREYTLRIEPTSRAWPTVVCTNFLVGLVDAEGVQSIADPLRLPDVTPSNAVLTVRSTEGDGVEGAQVIMTLADSLTLPTASDPSSSWQNCTTQFTSMGFTHSSGTVPLPALVAGNGELAYDFNVVPPIEGPFAAETMSRTLADATTSLEPVVLVTRRDVLFNVIDHEGIPVVGATLEAIPADQPADDSATASRGTTDEAGQAILFLGPGPHVLTVIPAIASGLPRFTIGPRTLLTPPIAGYTVTVPQPLLFKGRVLLPDNQPPENFLFKLYSMELTAQTLVPPVLLGVGSTVAGDRFELIIADGATPPLVQ